MSATTEQPKALTKDEWRELFEQQVVAEGLDPETPFEDHDGSDAANGARSHGRTGAIDPRDAINPETAKAYVDFWRAQAQKSSSPLAPAIIQSFLRLGEALPEPAMAAAPAPVKKTIEQWGEAKGFLPQVLPQANPNRKAAATLTVGSAAVLGIAQRHNPEFWKFAAAKAGNAWPDGFEITEADFDAQIDGHTNLAHG